MSFVLITRKIRPFLWIGVWVAWLAVRLSGRSLSGLLVKTIDELHNGLEQLGCPALIMAFFDAVYFFVLDIAVLLVVMSGFRLGYLLTSYTVDEWKELFIAAAFEFMAENISFVRKELKNTKHKAKEDTKKALGKDPNRTITSVLPKQGISSEQLIQQMEATGRSENEKWQKGKVSGTVYGASEEHTKLMNATYASFSWANPLHPGIWPTVNQCEAEVISMTASIMHVSGEAIGTTSSGGTESIILAIKAHRDFYGKKRSIRYPEIVCSSTAHAAVDKACELLGIRKIVVPCDQVLFTASAKDMERRITSNTIMMYSSAPSFPQGVIDPIEELSQLALRYDIGLHVDCCLGGFVLPFAKKLIPEAIPKFDFECAGVTSMSVDTHKFAYASKGTSVVLYRSEELRHAQYFTYAKWTGGMYATPTIAGSRPGALLACAWAALVSIGEQGYLDRVKSILECSKFIADGVNKIPDLKVLDGRQRPTMVVCFASDTLDIYGIYDAMEKKGWSLNALQDPSSVHICVTLHTIHTKEAFLSDLASVTDAVRADTAKVEKAGGTAAIYGMTVGLPKGPVNELLKSYTDVTLMP